MLILVSGMFMGRLEQHMSCIKDSWRADWNLIFLSGKKPDQMTELLKSDTVIRQKKDC